MAHHQEKAETVILSVIEEYSHSDMALGPQVFSMNHEDQDAVKKTLLIMAHAHIHSSMALMKQAGLTPQEIAEEFYIYADQQAPFDITT
jgi:hypothetical protein